MREKGKGRKRERERNSEGEGGGWRGGDVKERKGLKELERGEVNVGR